MKISYGTFTIGQNTNLHIHQDRIECGRVIAIRARAFFAVHREKSGVACLLESLLHDLAVHWIILGNEYVQVVRIGWWGWLVWDVEENACGCARG